MEKKTTFTASNHAILPMQKNKYASLIVFIAASLLFSSCASQKQIVYFQKGINQGDTTTIAKAFIPTIQPGDLLGVYVSSLSPAASSFFNPYAAAPASDNASSLGGTSSTGGQGAPQGYLVDNSGSIELPLLGPLKVSGLSTTQAKNVIKERLQKYLKEPTVNIRFLNYKISVMGEVNKPAVYVIPNERVTLPEALSMAGDLTIYGKRTNILIARDNNGKKEFGRVDLTSREVYNSAYYYLRANDIIYVEPSQARIQQSDPIFRFIPIVLSSISLIVVAFYYGRH